MTGFNLIFHVFAAIAFVVLGLMIRSLQAKVSFHRQLWLSLDTNKVMSRKTLSWPGQFLRQFAAAFEIPLLASGSIDHCGEPRAIDLKPLLDFYLNHGLRQIHCTVNSGLLLATLVPGKPVFDNSPQLIEHLKKALGKNIEVSIQLDQEGTP